MIKGKPFLRKTKNNNIFHIQDKKEITFKLMRNADSLQTKNFIKI